MNGNSGFRIIVNIKTNLTLYNCYDIIFLLQHLNNYVGLLIDYHSVNQQIR